MQLAASPFLNLDSGILNFSLKGIADWNVLSYLRRQDRKK